MSRLLRCVLLARTFSHSLLVLILSSFAFASTVVAQVANVDDTTSTPIEGIGHDYIHALSETVNPANGSVSLRIQVPLPKGRGISLPFSFGYDSNSAHHLQAGIPPNYGTLYWQSNNDSFAQGGWSNSIPTLRADTWTVPINVSNTVYDCFYQSNYVFRDPSGGVHALNIGSLYWISGNPSCGTAGAASTGSDSQMSASIPTGSAGVYPYPVTVNDDAGTVYYFGSAGTTGPTGTWYSFPTYIEDRNGNRVVPSSNALTLTDTLGRTLISMSGFGPSGTTNTISFPGMTYHVTWKTTSANFSVPSTWVGPTVGPNDNGCSPIAQANDSQTVVSQITLPNGQAYKFYYGTDNPDPNFRNPYGLLSEIDYPTGGWVKYTWKLSDTLNEVTIYPGSYNAAWYTCSNDPTAVCPAPIPNGCMYQYETPVVASRQVGFGGSSTAAQVQTFTYLTTWGTAQSGNAGPTTWTQKTTNVSTTDNVTGKTALTSYSYAPFTLPTPPWSNVGTSQVPNEATTKYYDWGNTTTPLRTVNKTWLDTVHLASQQTVLDTGASSKTTYTYVNSGGFLQPTEVDAYDFGASSPTHKTITNYQGFSGTPGILADAPCQVLVKDASNNVAAETDYLYDGGTAVCGTSGSGATSTVSNLPAGTHDETVFGPGSSTPRGNVTSITRKCLQACSNSTTTLTYDETGQVLTMTDPCGNATCSDISDTNHTTTYSYVDNYDSPPSGNTNAYLTRITRPTTSSGAAHVQTFKYAYADGQLIASTDENGQTTQYVYNTPPPGCSSPDGLDRLSSITYPDTGKTTYCYNDAPYNPSTPSPSVTATKAINSSTNLTTLTAFDGLGHTIRSVLTSDPDCASGDRSDTTYDGLGRVYTVSNPYCSTSDPTYGLTTYTYDALGRTCVVASPTGTPQSNCPSGAIAGDVVTVYAGRATEVFDEGNGTKSVARISQTDGLGRLVSVCEVTGTSLIGSGGTPGPCGQDIAATGFLTTHQYDPLDNLLQVNQAGIGTRTFAYDSLSRLASASNPESGTMCYGTYSAGVCQGNGYDANGNLTTKTDARNVTTTYGYDALNRLTGKTYSDGTPAVTLNYDQTSALGVTLTNTIGRRSSESTAGSLPTGSVFSYDRMGHVADNSQCTPQNCGTGVFALQYPQYDFLGDLVSGTNAAGVTFTYSYNIAARLTGITTNFVDQSHPGSLFSSAHYAPFGPLTSSTLGNSLNESLSYDKRLREQSYSAKSGSTTRYSFNITSFAPNGDILAANDSVNGNWTYSYDDFNRLSGSNQNSGQAVYSYVYDRFGNRWQQNGPHSMQLTFTGNNPSSPQNNNRMDGYSYDAVGNLLNDGTHSYFYDAENRLIQVDGTLGNCSTATACYVYDAEGRRVRKARASGTLDFLYDAQGHKVAEVDTTGTFQRGELYAGDRHFAVYAPDPGPSGATFFIHADWLGTERARTNMNRAACETIKSLPFGDAQTISDSCGDSARDVSPMHFTGKERDSESGNDNFGARYYSSSFGRFLSPDEPLVDQQKGNPQSWNLYSYVRNNPLNGIDPSGRDCVYLNNVGNGVESIDHNSNQGECDTHGGFWANGTVEANWWVKTDPDSDTVHIWSHYKDIVGETWAGPGWSHGDKYANVIPQVQARDQSLDYELRMWGALAVMHGPGGLPEEGDTGSPVEDLPRTGSALKKDLYHAFPDEVDNSAGAGTATQLRPGVTLYQVEGSYMGKEGRFEWIVDNGNVTHRMFVEGGKINGVPIKP